MKADALLKALGNHGIQFFTGVPDSLLGALCDEIYSRFGTDPRRHLVAHNEGGAVAYAAGYHLATGKIPCVYLQNSGVGNIINAVASLTSPVIYGLPVLYAVGWRGQPGIKDEPQHKLQGVITEDLLKNIGITVFPLGAGTTETELSATLDACDQLFAEGHSAALLVEKNAIAGETHTYTNAFSLPRENAVERIVKAAADAIVVSSTGKISRELFEVRERLGQDHGHDFLTVGSMGHDSMIALGIAVQKPDKQVWCVQGDGAFLMHMGAAASVGHIAPQNLRYVVLNNTAHESVGGMPTCGFRADLAAVAASCGFKRVFRAENETELEIALSQMTPEQGAAFLEVKCAIGSRDDLGRPTTSPRDNKHALMRTLAVF